MFVCSRVIGGHEFQAAELARALGSEIELHVFVNHPDQVVLFSVPGVTVELLESKLLGPGRLLRQLFAGLATRPESSHWVDGFDRAIVSAGAVEASVRVGLSLRGRLPVDLYLPFFYDRRPIWGMTAGSAYNAVLGLAGRIFDRILTINRIQASIISRRLHRPTFVIPNRVRRVVSNASKGEPRLVFVGRLDRQKRIDELLRWLDFDGVPHRLLVIGDGPLRASLEDQGLQAKYLKVEFLGWLGTSAQDAELRASDILVLNSLVEGEPLVIREARLRGMRILARDIVGVRGITRRSERFRSAFELHQAVMGLVDAPAGRAPTNAHSQDERRRRAIVQCVAATQGVRA